jgi:hypothetical protein
MPSDNIASMPELARDTAAAEQGRGDVDMAALWRDNVGAAMASSQAAVCGIQEITSTLLAFLQSRAKDGLAASQQLAACESPEALVEVQLECLKAMLQAYTDEFGRLHGLAGKILADLLVPTQARAVAVPGTIARASVGALAA